MNKPAIAVTRRKDRRGAEFVVREASPDDAAALLRMIRGVFDERLPELVTRAEEFDVTEEKEREFLLKHRESESSAAFLAVDAESDEPLGFLNGGVTSRWKLAHVWNFGMSVAKPHRGRGIGRTLLEQAVVFVEAHPGLTKISLEVIADNARAIRLYESLGFEPEGRRIKGVRREAADGTVEYVDEILMYRWLG